MNVEELYKIYRAYPSVQTDTRKLQKGDIFFALSGPNFNGNQFALKALEAGASYAVVDEDISGGNDRIIKVDDTLNALQQLAKHHREQFKIPFIGITGSNGKTTTKELVSTVLSSHFKTYTTKGNLNNHIGVPLTLLQIKDDGEMAVIEMGANHQKEIEGYCKYAQPTHGIITNCGKAHLEGFGGIEGVRKGKGELYKYLSEHDGTAFIYRNYDYLQEMSGKIRHKVWYGMNEGDVTGTAESSEPFLSVKITSMAEPILIKTQLVGAYNLPNVLCAVAVGMHFKVPVEKIVAALEAYSPDNSRSQMITKGTNKIILDAYNANPTSMKAAIENIGKISADKKVLMLGGMMELGEDSLAEHKAIVDLIDQYKWEQVVFVGGDFKNTANGHLYFENSEEAASWAAKQNLHDSYLLIKGSRSIKMEKIAEKL